MRWYWRVAVRSPMHIGTALILAMVCVAVSNRAAATDAIMVAFVFASASVCAELALRVTKGQRVGAQVLDRFEAQALPDMPYHTPRIFLEPEKYSKLINLRVVSRKTREILVVAPQRGHEKRKYAFDTIKDQLNKVYERIAKRRSQTQLKWICYTTKNGSYVAHQPFAEFLKEIDEGRNEIVDILNELDETAFHTRLTKWSGEKRYSLSTLTLNEGVTSRTAIYCLFLKGQGNAMIVSDDRKPVGVATVGGLAKTLLEGMLVCPDDLCGAAMAPPPPVDSAQEDDFTEELNDQVEHDRLVGVEPPNSRSTLS